MKYVNKCLAFIKENKIIVCALVVVLLSFIFLALPGQFAHFNPNESNEKRVVTYFDYLNGYQWMFGTAKNRSGEKLGGPVGQGIAIFVMLILCIPGLLFSKKSSFVALITSLVLVTIAILFFTVSNPTIKAYSLDVCGKKERPRWSNMSWVPYVLGSFILIAGLAMSYRTFLVMKDEVKHPTQPKGPSYNYLHK